MKKRTLRLLSTAMAIALLLACVPAAAENDGQLSITVGNSNSLFERSGIELGIYLLATGDYGDWTMVEAFKDITVFTRNDGSATVSATMAQIAKRIRDDGIKPTKRAQTDNAGKAEFSNLTRGIYYVDMLKGPEGLTLSPMLLSAPNKEGSLQVSAAAKPEYTTPTPSPTPTPKPTPTPFTTPTPPPGSTPTPTPSITPAPPTPTPRPTPLPDNLPSPTPTPAPTFTPPPGEEVIPDYETALGLGNVQMHVGVCFD